MNHPEAPEGISEIIREVEGSEIGLVMCHGCGTRRPVNIQYLQYIHDGIRSCRFCRDQD